MTNTNATAHNMTADKRNLADMCRVEGRTCSDVACRASGCQMTYLEERNEQLEAALNQIAQWVDAFPLDDALSGANMGLVKGIGRIAKRAVMVDLREVQHA